MRSGSLTRTRRQKQAQAAADALIGIGPKDEIEGMLAAQMLAAHDAAMECYRRAMHPGQPFECRREALNQANKLSRTCTTLVEALNRHRGKGQQIVRVERVTVHEGGQAIVGPVTHQGGGASTKTQDQPHAIGHAEGAPMLGQIEAERAAVPVTRGSGS
jgi:hypothetical protein